MLRLLGYFWLFVIFLTTIFEYFWVFWDMQGYFQLCLALLTIMGNFWEFFIHLGKYWDILGTIGYYYGTHGYFCVVFGIGCVALCAQQLRTQHKADHAKPTMRRAPCSRQHFCSVENRVDAAVIPGPGHGPARAQQEDLEKKIPLVTRRSSLESSVIGLEVGQVDQGKRVLVQYIYYNLIISVFNN